MTEHNDQSAEDRAFRIRFRILASTVSLAFLPFALRNYLMGRPMTTALYTSACAIMFALFWAGLKASDLRQTRILAHLIVAIATLVSVVGALWTGQGQAVGIWGLVLSPLYATYLLGARWGPIWAGFSILAIIAILYPIQSEFVARVWQVAMSQIVITLMILIFGLGLRRGMDRKVDLLAAQAKILEKARDEALAADAPKSAWSCLPHRPTIRPRTGPGSASRPVRKLSGRPLPVSPDHLQPALQCGQVQRSTLTRLRSTTPLN